MTLFPPPRWNRWIAFSCAAASLLAFAAEHPAKAVVFAAAAAYFGIAATRRGPGANQ